MISSGLEFFSKKDLRNTNKIYKQKTKANEILIGLLFFIIMVYFEKIDKRNQHFFKKVAMFLGNSKNYPLFSLWLNDNEIIWDVSLGCGNESIDQGRSYADKNVNISNCFFSRYLSYSGYGGVIYANGGSYSMSIIYSMFYNCVCSGSGGAIWFESSYSCLRMICANSCSATSWGQFSYIIASQMNQVEYLSVSNCSHTTSGYCSIYLQYCDQRVDNTNSSMNNAVQYSGIAIQSPSSFTSSYCAFSNNKVSEWFCIGFWTSSGTIIMSYANIVHNNSPSPGVVIVNGAFPKMMYCIFHNNHNYLFCVNKGSLEVSHSFIDHSGSFSKSTSVSTSNNNSFTCIITYQLQFFDSLHCNADVPLE